MPRDLADVADYFLPQGRPGPARAVREREARSPDAGDGARGPAGGASDRGGARRRAGRGSRGVRLEPRGGGRAAGRERDAGRPFPPGAVADLARGGPGPGRCGGGVHARRRAGPAAPGGARSGGGAGGGLGGGRAGAGVRTAGLARRVRSMDARCCAGSCCSHRRSASTCSRPTVSPSACSRRATQARVGVTIHGARRIADAQSAFLHLAGVAARHLGRDLASYGLLVDDLHIYRAIVSRRPIGLEHPQSRAARALRDVARLLLEDARKMALA